MILCNIKLGRIIEWHSYHLCAIIKNVNTIFFQLIIWQQATSALNEFYFLFRNISSTKIPRIVDVVATK